MSAEHSNRALQIATEALKVPSSERSAFVAGACAGDEGLRSRVEAILREAADVGANESPQAGRGDFASAPTVDSASSSDHGGVATGDGGRFIPGAVVDGRYRIVGMLGRGGMGEVYRAEDLKLGQPVALKFLPPSLERDADRSKRFLAEVRLARSVAHRNVCRVWDIGETDGRPFLSMEYVDGEDLAALLRRIGRLPTEKALQIGRQICGALVAVHEAGIVHRDLKPANVMLDGRGQAKLTDFGLALATDSVSDREVVAGTPAYMAPEQLAGEEATARSDLYALGLVLYELLTGRPAFAAETLREHLELRRGSHPRLPSSVVEHLDPAVESVLARCLERDPARRPASAREVARLLPGGDALAAAVAAGETLPPEAVADAGPAGSVSPMVGGALAAAVAVGLVVVVGLHPKAKLQEGTPLPKSPAVLADRARAAAAALGYREIPNDRAFGFSVNQPYLHHLRATNAGGESLDRETAERRPSALLFDYWESREHLVGFTVDQRLRSVFRPGDPRPVTVRMQLDPAGRLFRFEAPGSRPVPGEGEEEPEWSPLFALAGLDEADLRSVVPVSQPPVFATRVAAWQGAYPDSPETPIRVEAAADNGVVVFFRIVEPWEPAPTLEAPNLPGWLTLLALLVAGLVARVNVRQGRGDLRGALRCGLYVFAMSALGWPLVTHHSGGRLDPRLLFLGISAALFTGATVWLSYLAVEPFVRRYWPTVLVSWTRLLDGRFRDAMVARDLLVGSLVGVASGLVAVVTRVGPEWFGSSRALPWSQGLDFTALDGFASALGELLLGQGNTAFYVLPLLVLLVALRMATRRTWAAVGGLFVLTVVTNLVGVGSVPAFVQLLANVVLFLAILFRAGLLPTLVGMFVFSDVLGKLPLTFDLSAWYAPASLLGFAVLACLCAHGLRWSVSLRPAASTT